MKKAKKKNGIVSSIIVAVLFYALGAMFVVLNIGDLVTPAKDIMDILDEEGDIEDGQYVTVGVDAVVDWYAETKHTVNYIPVGKEQHCIVWLEDNSFISLTVKKGDYDEIDDLIDKTWDYLEDESGMTELPRPVLFKGRITKLKTEVKRYYDESLSELGISRSENTVYNFTIDTTQTKTLQWVWIAVCFLIGTLFVMLAVRTGRKNKKSDDTGYGAGGDTYQTGYNGQNNSTYQNGYGGQNNSTYQNGYGGQSSGNYNDPFANQYQDPYNNSGNNNYNNPGIGQ